jgi:PAS domain S-box-containing protein
VTAALVATVWPWAASLAADSAFGDGPRVPETLHLRLGVAASCIALAVALLLLARARREETSSRQANAYNRSLIEASLDPFVSIGPDGKITDVNAATETLTGAARQELIGSDFSEYFADPPRARAGYQQAFREGAVRGYALELRHRKGRVTSVVYNASVYHGKNGEVAGVFAVAHDVTAQKRAEALHARLAAIVDSANDAIIAKGLDGVVLTWNPAAERLFGYPAQEIIGQHIDVLIPDDRRTEEAGIRERIRRGELVQHFESVRLRKDRTRFAVALTVSPIKDGEGRVVAACKIVRDITGQKQAEEALRGNAYHRNLIEASLDPLVTIGPNGNITDANAATESATGCPRAQLIGTDFSDYFTEPAQARAVYQQVFREGSVRDYPLDLRHRDGRVTSVLYNAAVYRDEQAKITGVLAAARDITQRKRAEEQIRLFTEDLKRRNQELEQFAYVASHDLQEPLRAMSSFSELLAERYRGKLDPDADEFIGFIVDGGRRMQKLIEGLLSYSRVGTRGQPLKPVDCEQVFEAARSNLELAIRESGARLRHEPLPTVLGDELQLVQLFQNLLSNAIKFRPPGQPPQIEVSAAPGQARWTLTFRDNGIGIEPQFFNRLFIIFQRLHSQDRYGGTGIGLAVCKKIVERHGGRIWIESALGRGSAFHLTLPASNQPPP